MILLNKVCPADLTGWQSRLRRLFCPPVCSKSLVISWIEQKDGVAGLVQSQQVKRAKRSWPIKMGYVYLLYATNWTNGTLPLGSWSTGSQCDQQHYNCQLLWSRSPRIGPDLVARNWLQTFGSGRSGLEHHQHSWPGLVRLCTHSQTTGIPDTKLPGTMAPNPIGIAGGNGFVNI